MGFVVDFDFAVGCSHLHKCRGGPTDLLLGTLPVEVFRIGAVGGSGVILPISGLACRRASLVVPFLGRLREVRGMNRHDRGNACVVRGGGRERRRSGSLGHGDGLDLVRGGGGGLRISRSWLVHGWVQGLGCLGGHRDLAGEGRLRQHPILVCCGRGRLSLVTRGRRRSGCLGHAERAAHQGGDALIVGVDGEDDGQMGDGFGTPAIGDQEFSEMLA